MYKTLIDILKTISDLNKSIDNDIETLELLANLFDSDNAKVDKKSLENMFNDVEERVLIKIEELTWYKNKLEQIKVKLEN